MVTPEFVREQYGEFIFVASQNVMASDKRAITLLSSAFSSQAVSKEYGVEYVVGEGTVSLYVPEVDDDVDALVEAVYVKLLY
jgi:hypothetical protein